MGRRRHITDLRVRIERRTPCQSNTRPAPEASDRNCLPGVREVDDVVGASARHQIVDSPQGFVAVEEHNQLTQKICIAKHGEEQPAHLKDESDEQMTAHKFPNGPPKLRRFFR